MLSSVQFAEVYFCTLVHLCIQNYHLIYIDASKIPLSVSHLSFLILPFDSRMESWPICTLFFPPLLSLLLTRKQQQCPKGGYGKFQLKAVDLLLTKIHFDVCWAVVLPAGINSGKKSLSPKYLAVFGTDFSAFSPFNAEMK